MKIRQIGNISQLRDYVNGVTITEFYSDVIKEYKEYKNIYYETYKEKRLTALKKKGDWLRYHIYKRWAITNNFMRIYHKMRGVKNPQEFYTKGAFETEFDRLRYPLIGSENKEPFIEFVNDMYMNIEEYIGFYDTLEDDKSKEILFGILKGRVTGNFDLLMGCAEEVHKQYFANEIVDSMEGMVFCDVGGYIGDTTEILLTKYKGIKRVYFYEPNGENMEKAQKILQDYIACGVDIILRPVGVSNKKAKAYISNEKIASRILKKTESKANSEYISLVTLDEDINEEISFIKMDIEGEETAAIEGMQNHIKEDNPKLAVCVYHKVDDLLMVKNSIQSYNNNYKLYLRHYSDAGFADTVLYCIPNH